MADLTDRVLRMAMAENNAIASPSQCECGASVQYGQIGNTGEWPSWRRNRARHEPALPRHLHDSAGVSFLCPPNRPELGLEVSAAALSLLARRRWWPSVAARVVGPSL